MDKYHGADKPADETGTNAEATPKEMASPDADAPPEVDPNASRPPRKARHQAVKAGKADSPVQGIGKK